MDFKKKDKTACHKIKVLEARTFFFASKAQDFHKPPL